MRRASRKGLSVAGTVLVAGLMVFVLTSTSVEAAPVPAATSLSGTWSYGIVKTVTVTPQHASGGWLYEGSATLGYTVTIYDNATSTSTFELTVLRTMGVSFTVQFCQPSCSSPLQWVNESFRIYESTTTFANFTDQGSVTENGTSPAQAIALENTTSFLHANLTESSNSYLPALGQRGPHLTYLGADVIGESAVTFEPAFGLFPTQLYAGSTWNSTSAFTESGEWAYTYYYAAHAPLGSFILGPSSGGGSLATHGEVSLQGAYPTGNTFTYGGATYPAITLLIYGPFEVREGVIFIPSSADLFGTSEKPWGNNESGTASAQMGTLDVRPGAAAQLELVASSWSYSSATANAGITSSLSPAGTGLSPVAAPSNPISSATVQGIPETTDQAHGAQQCLTTGGSCPSTSGAPNLRGLFALIVLSGVVVMVGAIVAALVVTRRRRAPPPVYPNAVLYPPGAAFPSAPAGAAVPPAAPPPPEEDPLDHLW